MRSDLPRLARDEVRYGLLRDEWLSAGKPVTQEAERHYAKSGWIEPAA